MNRLERDLATLHYLECTTERRTPGDLTNERNRATILHKSTYIFTATWRSTSKSFKVVARSEESAYDKASKSKESLGCLSLRLVRTEP